MIKVSTLGAAVLSLAVAATLAAPGAFAQIKKHDSNTLHKLGKAIQYPINKAGQNTSVDVHRAEGRNSVVHRRNGNRTHKAVVTPSGNLYRIHHTVRHHSRRHHTMRHHTVRHHTS